MHEQMHAIFVVSVHRIIIDDLLWSHSTRLHPVHLPLVSIRVVRRLPRRHPRRLLTRCDAAVDFAKAIFILREWIVFIVSGQPYAFLHAVPLAIHRQLRTLVFFPPLTTCKRHAIVNLALVA